MRRRAVFWAILGHALFGACLRPSEERARADEEVGRLAAAGLSADVREGRAVVRRLGPEGISLWASAPVLELTVEGLQPRRSGEPFRVEVDNAMVGARLRARFGAAVDAAAGSSEPLDVSPFVDGVEVGPGERRAAVFEVALPTAGSAGTLHLRLAPPGAETVGDFRFAVLSDVQEAVDEVQDIFRLMNERPELQFLLGAGDLTRQGTHRQLRRFQRELRRLRVPYYTTLGNHELGDSHTNYHQYFGRGSQSFEYRGVRFTLLDSASATIDPIVYGWLDGWLEAGRHQPHVVAMHIPPLDPVGVRNGAFARRAEAAKLLARFAEQRVDLTLYGHIHSYYHFENAGIPAHVSGGGGAIPERFDDIGRHFLVVDARPAGQQFRVSVVRVD